MRTVWIGFDPKEEIASRVLSYSIMRRTSIPVDIRHLGLRSLRQEGIYTRTHETREGALWDTISDAPMSTEFALTRFTIPYLHTEGQWSVFMDSDMLVLADIGELFDHANDQYAVLVAKHHNYTPRSETKKSGQVQKPYARKNWSSLMLINHDHPAWKRFTLEDMNRAKGLFLHQFRFLSDGEIGSLPLNWNFLVGDDKPDSRHRMPKNLHFTYGGPWLENPIGVPPKNYAGLWEQERMIMEYLTRRRLPSETIVKVRQHAHAEETVDEPEGPETDAVS